MELGQVQMFYVYFRTCRTDQLDPSRSAVISYLAGHLNRSTNAARSKPLPLLEPSNILVRSNSTDQKKDQTMAVVKKKLRKNKKELKEATTLQTNSTRYKQKKMGHFIEIDYTIPCNCPFNLRLEVSQRCYRDNRRVFLLKLCSVSTT
jgi:hypothetical protein